MQLTVRDVAKLLNVSEKTIYRWLQNGDLPAYRVNDQYRFNRAELLEWATSRKIGTSVDFFSEPESSGAPLPGLAEALRHGGIFYRIEGGDKAAVVANLVGEMRLPPEADRDFLAQVILARESLGTTAVGDGIAIPHVRNPIVLHVELPMITLSFLERPIDFGALDGKPVFALFTLVSPTVRSHLHLLSRLAFALRDPAFKEVIGRQGSREEILAAAARVEAGIAGSDPGEGGRDHP
jgi:PTS system nitrogen regulatory IIA component